jgi:SAM-dependent methyltransferase
MLEVDQAGMVCPVSYFPLILRNYSPMEEAAIYLAKLGHKVTLLDISSTSLELAEERAAKEGVQLRTIHANALDLMKLQHLQSNHFDLVLCLGPLYHLLGLNERNTVLDNCIRLTRPGGYLLSASVSRYAHLRDIARKDPGRLAREAAFYKGYLTSGEYTRRSDNVSYHALPQEVAAAPQHPEVKLERVIACEGFLGANGAKHLSGLNGDEFEAWIKVIMAIAEQREMLGATDHILSVLHKLQNYS